MDITPPITLLFWVLTNGFIYTATKYYETIVEFNAYNNNNKGHVDLTALGI